MSAGKFELGINLNVAFNDNLSEKVFDGDFPVVLIGLCLSIDFSRGRVFRTRH